MWSAGVPTRSNAPTMEGISERSFSVQSRLLRVRTPALRSRRDALIRLNVFMCGSIPRKIGAHPILPIATEQLAMFIKDQCLANGLGQSPHRILTELDSVGAVRLFRNVGD